MSPRPATWLAWALGGVSLILAVAGAVVAAQGSGLPLETVFASRRGTALMVVQLASVAVVGAVVASRHPRHRLGWLLVAGAGIGSAWLLADGYAVWGLVLRPGAPGGVVAAWLGNWLWVPMWGLVAPLAFLLFPDGRLPSARWRPVAYAVVALCVVNVVGLMLASGPLAHYPFQLNPVGLPDRWGSLARGGLPAAEVVMRIVTVVAAAGLLTRLVRARGEERAQIEWFAYASALTAGLALATELPIGAGRSRWLEDAAVVVAAAPALAVGIAIQRYRLYEIDRIISRTVSYAVLTAVLVAVYAGAVFGLQHLLRPVTGESELAVAGATLAVAALFGPLRARVQRVVDGRFNRARYDAQRTVAIFRARLRHEVDLDHLEGDLVGAVRATVQPAKVTLWLRARDEAG